MGPNLPLAPAGASIGLLGGSFDPAHDAHLAISRTALRRLQLDRIWWLVSPGNPLKAHGPAPLAQRMAAARALVHDPRIVITDIEARLGLRKTADTIAALRRLYPGTRFVWLMGSDNLVQFHHWDRWTEIARSVPIAVMARPGSRLQARHAPAALVMRRNRLPEHRAALLARMAPPAWTLLNMPMSSLSSTQIRSEGRNA